MVFDSYLLSISGSKQSLTAAKVALALAKRSGAHVTAMHVVDANSGWQLLCSDGAGFIKRETAHQAFKILLQLLKSMSGDIIDSFEELVEMSNTPGSSLIAEGDPIAEVSVEAASHDLVIIGHKPNRLRSGSSQRRTITFHSFAKALAHECARPLLVVQDECPPWTKLLIMAASDHINQHYINSCLALAKKLSMEPELFVLRIGESEESSDHLVDDLRRANPPLREVTIHTRVVSELIQIENDGKHRMVDATSVEHEIPSEVLLVVPTRNTGNERLTVFGNTADVFIERLSSPAIMLWPEEFVIDAKNVLELADASSFE